jgi:alpha-D-ribose 1-methylphosphonate 5-triphosphate synthase subunit PhnG
MSERTVNLGLACLVCGKQEVHVMLLFVATAKLKHPKTDKSIFSRFVSKMDSMVQKCKAQTQTQTHSAQTQMNFKQPTCRSRSGS